jgi:hypothetical protein
MADPRRLAGLRRLARLDRLRGLYRSRRLLRLDLERAERTTGEELDRVQHGSSSLGKIWRRESVHDRQVSGACGGHAEHARPGDATVRRLRSGMPRDNVPDAREIEFVDDGAGFDSHDIDDDANGPMAVAPVRVSSRE